MWFYGQALPCQVHSLCVMASLKTLIIKLLHTLLISATILWICWWSCVWFPSILLKVQKAIIFLGCDMLFGNYLANFYSSLPKSLVWKYENQCNVAAFSTYPIAKTIFVSTCTLLGLEQASHISHVSQSIFCTNFGGNACYFLTWSHSCVSVTLISGASSDASLPYGEIIWCLPLLVSSSSCLHFILDFGSSI